MEQIESLFAENDKLKRELKKSKKRIEKLMESLHDTIVKCHNCQLIMSEDDSFDNELAVYCDCPRVWCKDCFDKLKQQCESCDSTWFCKECIKNHTKSDQKCKKCCKILCNNCDADSKSGNCFKCSGKN